MASTPEANDLTRLIFLLGRRDAPTDGVQDYCEYLSQSLKRRGIQSEIARVDWFLEGWVHALRKLWDQSASWQGACVILQYTALNWSARGFPLGILAVLWIVRHRGIRCAAIFHDPRRQGGLGWTGPMRGAFQNWIIRRIYDDIDRAIFADPLNTIDWLPKNSDRAAFIPIGANLPDGRGSDNPTVVEKPEIQTVAVYCLSDPPNLHNELRDISHAIGMAANGRKLRVMFLGRGTAEAQEEIRSAFVGIPAEASILGVLDGNEVRDILSDSDAMLCVRGVMHPRRGSAIAGIACGLPILGYGTNEAAFPISEAGVRLFPYRDSDALGAALAQILGDPRLQEQLRAASRAAQKRLFSWDIVADKLIQALNDPHEQK
jgi:glycosyltransferase involved in cell wall biosynthesis